MNEEIVFNTKPISGGTKDYLKRVFMGRRATGDLLQIVFDHGGYIAGGFAALLARDIVISDLDHFYEDVETRINAHLGMPKVAPSDYPKPWHYNAGCGDIDVWFPDERTLEAFLNDPRRQAMINAMVVQVEPTITGIALEHIVLGQARVQVIKAFLMPVQEQLSRFDIYNSMVAITDQDVVYPEHWVLLEKQHMLHVSTWKTPWTVNRFLKYMDGRKGYDKVTPLTADSFIDAALETMYVFKQKKDASPAASLTFMNQNKLIRMIGQHKPTVQVFFKSLIDVLPAERLLDMSALFAVPADYDLAMQELRRRASINPQDIVSSP